MEAVGSFLAPLVVGSMVPDAGYFLPLPAYYKAYAHSWLGAFTSSIPLGLGILLVLYWLGPALIFLLPNPHCEALQGSIHAPVFSLRAASLAVFGILIGVESHLAWDSFTHRYGWLVQRVPALYAVRGIHPYLILQLLTSVIGLWFVLQAYHIWTNSAGIRPRTVQGPTWRSLRVGNCSGLLDPSVDRKPHSASHRDPGFSPRAALCWF